MKAYIGETKKESIEICWDRVDGADEYSVFWADCDSETMQFQKRYTGTDNSFTLKKSTHIPHYFYVEAYKSGKLLEQSEELRSEITYTLKPQLEKLNRGLVAVETENGVFLAWRMFRDEAKGAQKERLTGTDYIVYRNGEIIATVADSTNYLDADGKYQDEYRIAPISAGMTGEQSEKAAWAKKNENYLEIPMQIPRGGVTPAGQEYTYSVNDMSVGDVDGDGELEYFVKWDPSNSHDVSHKGYTGNCIIDCYKLSGRLLWRLDMGVNIRAGAHYTQFMVYDFDGDGRAEMSVKTAPGTKMTKYAEDGSVISEKYITIPDRDIEKGVTHAANYVCSKEDYYEHIVQMFMNWREHSEVINGSWPDTLEECFGVEKTYKYPLSREDAVDLADYFMDEYAPSRSDKNDLRNFEGFIYEGPEYLTMFAGDGSELETIDFPIPREDDGLMWGDYEWNRIEPCNRVDRFQSAVGYLDGEHPYLIICRGYYTRTVITAYTFKNGRHQLYFKADSGYVKMPNPFRRIHYSTDGSDPVYGCIAGQGDHSMAVADVDGDGCQEIIYGACTLDHDGSVLYSSRAACPDGRIAKLGHGDAMHVAKINPDLPGYQIFNVFEGGATVPYGYALRDAETGEAFFGEASNKDMARCMIGDINPNVRGLQVWVREVQDCNGNYLQDKPLGTNASIKWAADLSTQVTDGVDYVGGRHVGVITDNTHGIMLIPEHCATNNGTKGNPCLVADIFGDFREELVIRTEDSTAVRIYVNTEITDHKLFTLLHDPMYRCGVAWQNNVYNQPCYTSFYYASDMDFRDILLV